MSRKPIKSYKLIDRQRRKKDDLEDKNRTISHRKTKKPQDFDLEELLDILEIWAAKDTKGYISLVQKQKFYKEYGQIFQGDINLVKTQILKKFRDSDEQMEYYRELYWDETRKNRA